MEHTVFRNVQTYNQVSGGITQKERIQRSQHGESFKVEEIYQFYNYSSPLETQPEETLKPVYFAASSWLHW